MTDFADLDPRIRAAYVPYTEAVIGKTPATSHLKAMYEGDLEDFADFGRYPEGSPLASASVPSSRRRSAIQALIDRGATEGERDAAREALARIDAQDEDDYLDAVRAGEA